MPNVQTSLERLSQLNDICLFAATLLGSSFTEMVNIEMDVDSEITDIHRCFLQVCANHGSQSIPQALNILMHIKRKCM